ncbi:MAG: FliI/YscN family ATPase [Acidobacteriota bacterium]|jgi:FliI/YscN family ATPase|nr:FliI/YscN family ATPase [Acidobacteriota bacterium]
MANSEFNLNSYFRKLNELDPIKTIGSVKRAVGLVVESLGPPVSVGELCELVGNDPNGGSIPAEVVGFKDNYVISMPLYKVHGVKLGDKVICRKKTASIPVGPALLGRVVNALGEPIDDLGPIEAQEEYPIQPPETNPLGRKNIEEKLGTGIRAIDGMLTCGKGQRIGIFGGSGVGKSTLLGMMARYTSADINVISLVGERGREVRGFIEKDLGEEGLKRSVVVVSTSDQPPLLRIRAALVATTIAEYFRDQGKDVLLVMDSVTRFAMAQREVGLAAGEPPSSKGYTPSVFSLLPRLVERAGNFMSGGSITGFYTVLVEGDDMSEPIADAVRSLLDGHVVLSRELAWRNHYPCIDILASISRLMPDLVPQAYLQRAGKIREMLSTFRKAEDMVNIGAYVKGSNPKIDLALKKIDTINAFLVQRSDEKVPLDSALTGVEDITKDC